MVARPDSPPPSVCEIERAVSAIVTWSARNDVQEETMRRARCDLPRNSIWLLGYVVKCGPVRLGDLAAALGVDASTLTPQAKRLEREGLLSRRPDPGDRRASLLNVTRAGRGMLARMQRVRESMLGEFLGTWTDGDRESVARALTRLAASLGT